MGTRGIFFSEFWRCKIYDGGIRWNVRNRLAYAEKRGVLVLLYMTERVKLLIMLMNSWVK